MQCVGIIIGVLMFLEVLHDLLIPRHLSESDSQAMRSFDESAPNLNNGTRR